MHSSKCLRTLRYFIVILFINRVILHINFVLDKQCIYAGFVITVSICNDLFFNLSAVLSSTLDLLDLSEPGERKNSKDRNSLLSSRCDRQKNNSHKKKTDETELIQVEVEQTGSSMRTTERRSLDSGVSPISF